MEKAQESHLVHEHQIIPVGQYLVVWGEASDEFVISEQKPEIAGSFTYYNGGQYQGDFKYTVPALVFRGVDQQGKVNQYYLINRPVTFTRELDIREYQSPIGYAHYQYCLGQRNYHVPFFSWEIEGQIVTIQRQILPERPVREIHLFNCPLTVVLF